jgi:HD-GYP domain-containing protein (c-di-GMP phosphodiesterase class II)/DNA-binding CsgD family transcriptional regulator
MERSARDSGITLAELLAAFSLATDLGLGQPMEHVLRSWRIASRLGERVGMSEQERRPLFFIAMLSWVGCVADTPEVAAWFGDDIAFRGDSYQVEMVGLPGLAFLVGHAGAGASARRRLRLAAALTVTGGKGIIRGIQAHCATTSTMAARLGLGPEVCDPLRQFFTRLDGHGVPAGIGGEQIAATMRLFHLADVVEVYHRADGVRAAVEVARARRGRHFDPAVVAAFCAAAGEVLGDGQDVPDTREMITTDPALGRRLTEPELDERLEALADFTDLRSACRAGHSRGVASLAAAAARSAGLPADSVTKVRRAGLVHDIGLHGVPASILDKPAPLTATESERMRLSSYYTERVLAQPDALARVGSIAALTHERMDGSGYHRRLSGPAIPAGARILAAADAYHAMTEPRPHRPQLTAAAAATALRAEVRAGRIAPDAADAVLAAAGAPRRRRTTGPAGLTPREVEVLTLIARGASTRQVAGTLGISLKTAATHIERIYTKTGASSRSTATLFALNHGLVDTLDPVDS